MSKVPAALFEQGDQLYYSPLAEKTQDAAVWSADCIAEYSCWVVFDYKSLLKKYPAVRQIICGMIFDCKLAVYLKNPAWKSDSLSDAFKALFPDENFSGEPGTADLLGRIYAELAGEFAASALLHDMEIPLAKVLCDMETEGVCVDRRGLQEFSGKLDIEIAALEKEIYSAVGREFNLNSTKQLSEVLWDELKLTPAGKKTKSGYSTDAEALEKMRGQHHVIELILQYRKLSKLNSTYAAGLLKYITSDNRIHTTFNMTATATGRLSSAEPNLQNIPIRSEQGGIIRKFFLAPEQCVLIDADYSQIELRILAHIAGDETLIRAFRQGEDIHTVTASQIFNTAPEAVTPEMRRRAKAVNFGIVYGISAFALANDLGVSRAEAEEYIASYFATYPGVKSYLDNIIKQARHDGFVETLSGRRRYLPELKSKIFAVRSFGERVALNMPIQGTAADLIKLAMVKVASELERHHLKTRLILQIHDELLLAAPEEEAEAAAELLKNCMESVADLQVPLSVSLAVGKNYADVK